MRGSAAGRSRPRDPGGTCATRRFPSALGVNFPKIQKVVLLWGRDLSRSVLRSRPEAWRGVQSGPRARFCCFGARGSAPRGPPGGCQALGSYLRGLGSPGWGRERGICRRLRGRPVRRDQGLNLSHRPRSLKACGRACVPPVPPGSPVKPEQAAPAPRTSAGRAAAAKAERGWGD